MNYKLVVGHDKLVARWVGNELGVEQWMYDVAAIGVLKDATPVAGVVYYAYRWPNIEMACASTDTRWLNKGFLREFFRYPFETLGCKRISSLVDVENVKAHAFNKKLGFVREAVLKDAHPGGDAVLYRMLKLECRWLNGQQRFKNDQSLRARPARNGGRAIPGQFTSDICECPGKSL